MVGIDRCVCLYVLLAQRCLLLAMLFGINRGGISSSYTCTRQPRQRPQPDDTAMDPSSLTLSRRRRRWRARRKHMYELHIAQYSQGQGPAACF